MPSLRTFIAVDIQPTILQTLETKIQPLRKTIGNAPVRWVPIHNFHLTLKFLGDIPPSRVDALTQTLRTEADSCHPFEMPISGLGSFPSSKRPRVLFIGIQAPAELDALQRGIESATQKLGYKPEGRDFSPHLTIGRVKENITAIDQQNIRKALEETTIDSLGTARVDSVHLYKSDLQPGGSVYTKLFSAPFQTKR